MSIKATDVENLPATLDYLQVASILGIHYRTVQLFAREGRLPATKIGRAYRFPTDKILELAGITD
ncbi:MAG: helix-turn-helix domain-containing protein [Atopobiaceae bacterium]|nr:helix-turn-helix domain-containing protein [Atopobiaceae bacterium]MCI2207667.1 helix-turn-helix domain-containing protein [Atopobiaceae bacterium]